MIRKNNVTIILKIISPFLLFFTMIPTNKFLIPYGILLIATLSERIFELDFSLDLMFPLLVIVGVILIFNKRRTIMSVGYFLGLIPIIVMFIYNPKDFNLYFWIPLILYLVIGIILVIDPYMKFSKVNSLTDKERYYLDKKNNE